MRKAVKPCHGFCRSSSSRSTQKMADHDVRRLEDFEVAAALADSALLHTLEPKDVMVTTMLPTPNAKWNTLSTHYAPISASMAAFARSRFHDFRMQDGGLPPTQQSERMEDERQWP